MNKFYITTSIAYVNAPPHIGFALESLQADVTARYRHARGDDVFFLTGTDEHGAKVARTAEASGKTPQALVDENAEKFKALQRTLNLSWNYFIRTSDQKVHWPVAQELWRRLADAGDLYKKTYKGLYCVGHEAFVTKKDITDGKCTIHKKEPELLEEENWFFKLSKYTKEIEAQIKKDELQIIPETRKNEILSLLKDGLEDVSFSRPSKDLSWGVPVPNDSSQTMYVWADALSNYISGYGLNAKASPDLPLGDLGAFEQWQKHPVDIHMIGKDILRFHAAIWPGMLLSAKLHLPKSIFVHGFITVEGEKMSKSLGNVVDPDELVKKYGTDPVRYYLLRELPSSEDGDFSYAKFEERYNGDLANGLGNFAARVSTLATHIQDIQILDETDYSIIKKINVTKSEVYKKLDEYKFNEALVIIWELIQVGDRYLNEKKPWEKSRTEDERREALCTAIMILDAVAVSLVPFLPETAQKISKNITITNGVVSVQKIENLFPRLDPVRGREGTQRFSASNGVEK